MGVIFKATYYGRWKARGVQRLTRLALAQHKQRVTLHLWARWQPDTSLIYPNNFLLNYILFANECRKQYEVAKTAATDAEDRPTHAA
jgi:hypothetical protein